MSWPDINWRASFAAVIGLAALVVLACGPPDDAAMRGGVIAPAIERPDALAGLLDLPAFVDVVVFPWSEVIVRRQTADLGELTVGVLVADTAERRSRGLMYWTGLPAGSGMIFVWEETRERQGGFWNQNVPIDLEVAWIDGDGVIFEFSTLWAEDRTSKQPEREYVFALEMPRGRFDELGITVGDQVLIPASLLPR